MITYIMLQHISRDDINGKLIHFWTSLELPAPNINVDHLTDEGLVVKVVVANSAIILLGSFQSAVKLIREHNIYRNIPDDHWQICIV